MSFRHVSNADRHHHLRLNRFVDMDPVVLEAAIAPVRDQLVPTAESSG